VSFFAGKGTRQSGGNLIEKHDLEQDRLEARGGTGEVRPPDFFLSTPLSLISGSMFSSDSGHIRPTFLAFLGR
jgi:hypothetical protein